MKIVKAVYYLYNLLRFGLYRLLGRYQGGILQGIPMSSQVVLSRGGSLTVAGKLSCRKNCYLSSSGILEIDEGGFFNNNVQIVSMEKIHIGKNVLIGPNAVIIDHDHDYKGVDRKQGFKSAPIIIGENVWIGANVVIMKGTTIGTGSVVGAGSVIKGEFPDNSLIYQEKTTKVKRIEA